MINKKKTQIVVKSTPNKRCLSIAIYKEINKNEIATVPVFVFVLERCWYFMGENWMWWECEWKMRTMSDETITRVRRLSFVCIVLFSLFIHWHLTCWIGR